jgi:DNA polymerase-3 subunit delta'
MSTLAPWLQSQLQTLMQRSGHAFLLQGPSGLGQYDLGLALASAWLCHNPTPQGACGTCPSCHGVKVRVHADLLVLMPETDMLTLEWPLPEKALKDIEDKKRKPSKEIRVEAMRDTIAFTQTTRSGAHGKVVFINPAERMNTITANTLLKTLEEPPGDTRFILACEAAHELLPTVRSRCQIHAMSWPQTDLAIDWLTTQSVPAEDADVLLQASGGRPQDAVHLHHAGFKAQSWRALPLQLSKGHPGVLENNSASIILACLQKICHDMLRIRVGGQPRFFNAKDLPAAGNIKSLSAWSKELMQSAKTVEHPYSSGLLLEAWVNRAQRAMNT